MKESIYDRLCETAGQERVRKQEPMSRHTTFRVGGPADYFITPRDPGMLRQLVQLCRREGEPFFILGNGSNLLVSDEGYRGVILQVYKNMNRIRLEGDCICAQAGALLSQIARFAQEHSLTGFEFASGIPGTLGGATVMNAGAYGGEMKDVLEQVTVLDESGEQLVLPAEELQMGYRTSVIKEKKYVVMDAVLRLKPGDQKAITDRMDELKRRRTSKQPLEFPSAGSTFKRPEGYFAGKLIMDAGLAGCTKGGAQVSEKHCGFVINRGNATAADVKQLMQYVRDKVKEEFGVVLEPEVKFLGFDWKE